MKMKQIFLGIAVLVSTVLTSQTQREVIIQDKTITETSPEADRNITATQRIQFLPNTSILEGSSFRARITEDAYLEPSFSTDENYIFTRTYQRAMSSATGIINNSDVTESITYFDGLGRAKQQIRIKASPQKKDIVTHIGYDEYGRQAKTYLPFERQTGTLGSFNTVNVNSDINTYYQNKYPDDFSGMAIGEINAYSERIFEASPLNRILEQGAPGKDWKANITNESDHTLKFQLSTNTDNEVTYFKVVFTNDDTEKPTLVKDNFYPENQLFITITKDENWISMDNENNTTKEYKNKSGQVILKRTYDQNIAHDTYYVYDGFRNLTYVIPPKVITDDGVSSLELSELCYQYVYDYRNRLVEKKIPGKGWEYVIYNKLDQPIMTQDANQGAKDPKEWLFTKYDAFGRVAYTGMYTDNTNKTRSEMQEYANNYAGGKQYELRQSTPATIDGMPFYYNNQSFPPLIQNWHTINYYDDYEVGNLVTFNPANGSGTWEGMTVTANVKGLPTVSQVRVLNTDQWITTATYYDDKGRAWESHVKNTYLDTEDWVLNKLDFSGKVLKTRSMHTKSGTTITTQDIFTYDHMRRLLDQTQTINSQASEVIVSNIYDELGKLASKEIGGGLQQIDYSYNVRGWLTQINDPTIALGDDLFAFGIHYNTTSENLGADALYNGNISETIWKTANDNTKRAYGYQYDALNRITAGLDNTADKRYSLQSIAYDKNGNISSLLRKGQTNSNATAFGTMDNLMYSYDNGNKLLSVTDNGNDSYGFNDGNSGSNDYRYDDNGNMIIDRNKGITGITYNHLNLPTTINFVDGPDDGRFIQYVYDANGTKLKKLSYDAGDEMTIGYAGNYTYNTNDDELIFINHSEGYIEPENDGTFTYIYQYKDHLGNIRLSYADDNDDGSVAISEIREEKNYYPFGLEHKGYNNTITEREHNYQTYQGQEFTEDLGLNWHEWKYRFSDPTTGRFISIDPLAEDYRYNGVYNFAENRVIDGNELEGLEWQPVNADGNKVGPNSDQIANYQWAGYDYKITRGAISTKGNVTEGITGFIMTPKEGTVAEGAIQGANSAGTEGATFFSVDSNKLPVKEFSALSSKSLSFEGSMETFPDNANKEWASGTLEMTSTYENGKELTDETWSAVSGPWGNGSLENGNYTSNNLRDNRTGAYSNNGVGYTFDINPTFTTGRTELRFHPDGGNYLGTQGCIGLTCGATGLISFRTRMNNYLSTNTSINVNVNITNNPNNNGY